MSLLGNGIEFLEIDDYNDSEGGGVDHRISRLGSNGEVVHTMEAEKRIRREIANSNERRRMQSINAGFQSLRTLLPRHEGEKLSKAAILQQTAEYIYALEQEKTRLLSQNCQLKRLLNQHDEGGDIPIKKRKTEAILAEIPQDIPENVSTESVAIISVVENANTLPSSEITDLHVQLDRERRLRIVLEDQVRTFESQMYPDSLRDLSHQITLQYENTEVMETEVEAEEEEGEELSEMVTLLPEAPLEEELCPLEECLLEEESGMVRPLSPVNMVMEAPRSPTPLPPPPVVPLALMEAAIKVEPKVKVEVVGEETGAEPSRLYLASTSRQNLETIVEAIRHLEGDQLFGEAQQELPLALTNKPDQRLLRVEMNDYLQFRPQSRPGVIVVKHS